MNWNAVGAAAELLGAVGVILSLLYVAAQVRHATKATRLDTSVGVMEKMTTLTEPLTGSREFSNLLMTALQGDDLESGGDRIHVHAWFFACLKTIENAHYLFERGTLEAEVWKNWEDWWSYWLRLPGLTAYWHDRRHVFRASFREAVDGWLEASGPMPEIGSATTQPTAPAQS